MVRTTETPARRAAIRLGRIGAMTRALWNTSRNEAVAQSPSGNVLGGDLDKETLDLIRRVTFDLEEIPGMTEYQKAQLGELSWWRQVAFHGYAGKTPAEFPKFQEDWMLSCFGRTGWSRWWLHFCSIVEIGCGPLGMVESLPGRKKVAFDPLAFHYQKLFHKAQSGKVQYVLDLGKLTAKSKGKFDLGICFNVLDHTTDSRGLFDAYMSLIKPGGRFLFEVNVVGGPRSEAHARMHPSPLTREMVRAWFDEYSEGYEQCYFDEPTPENEHFFMVWGLKNRRRASKSC
jgi:SAM-dependent methyltransferase